MPAGTAPPDPWIWLIEYLDRVNRLLAMGNLAAAQAYIEEQADTYQTAREAIVAERAKG